MSYRSGFLFVFTAVLFWAINGNVGASVFATGCLTPQAVTVLRLLLAGALLVAFSALRGAKPWEIWNQPKEALAVAEFGVFGLLFMQWFYFLGISLSNAPTGTIMQYMGAFLVVGIAAVRMRTLPSPRVVSAAFLAIGGAFLLLTHGQPGALLVSPAALAAGAAGAFGYAMVNILSEMPMKKRDAAAVTGWGMLAGGLALALLPGTWQGIRCWSPGLVGGVAWVVVMGTAIPFLLYLQGAKAIGPVRASIAACTEPILSAIIVAIVLRQPLHFMDWIGIVLIAIAVAMLALPDRNAPPASV